jgi:hypothetical protein
VQSEVRSFYTRQSLAEIDPRNPYLDIVKSSSPAQVEKCFALFARQVVGHSCPVSSMPQPPRTIKRKEVCLNPVVAREPGGLTKILMSNRYGIPEEDEKEIRAEDRTCVYCRKSMRQGPHAMQASGVTIEQDIAWFLSFGARLEWPVAEARKGDTPQSNPVFGHRVYRRVQLLSLRFRQFSPARRISSLLPACSAATRSASAKTTGPPRPTSCARQPPGLHCRFAVSLRPHTS